jgi:hypothetical protein
LSMKATMGSKRSQRFSLTLTSLTLHMIANAFKALHKPELVAAGAG